MSKIIKAKIEKIKPNPFRLLDKYPYDARKLETLRSSIEETGFWEGVVARAAGDEFQIAFGHHAIEAARRLELKTVPLVVRDLSDEQMLRLMSRKKPEDYQTSFLIPLEMWEATSNYLAALSEPQVKTIEVARFLGWTSIGKSGAYESEKLGKAARAASAALYLIKDGYNTYEDFEGLNVAAAGQIVEQAQSLANRLDHPSPYQTSTPERIEETRKRIAKAVTKTAEQVREGKLAQKDLRAAVDTNIYQFAREAKKQMPSFEAFGKRLADSIEKMLAKDASAKKLREMLKEIDQLDREEDKRVVSRIYVELGYLGERVEKCRRRISAKQEKSVAVKPEKSAAPKLIADKEHENSRLSLFKP
jgi:GGDEF domain-containing protein